jgi:hypothetical protein
VTEVRFYDIVFSSSCMWNESCCFCVWCARKGIYQMFDIIMFFPQ